MTPWYDKHRPQNLDDYVWTTEGAKEQIGRWITSPLAHPSLLLTGPTGTGKTTLAMIIRRMLDLGNDCKFIPASLRSGVETIRDEIVGFCEAGGFSPLKLIIMDEADRLSRDAQEMLRNVIDRYQDDVRFIFTCNRREKIIDPIQGRMWVFQVDALDFDGYLERLAEVCIAESVDIEDESTAGMLMQIAENSHPNMRVGISELQRAAKDGLLVQPEAAEVSTELLEQIQAVMAKAGDARPARAFVASLRPDQFDDVYRVLYENSDELFGDNQDVAIPIIAKHMFESAHAGLPDITLCACLILTSEVNT